MDDSEFDGNYLSHTIPPEYDDQPVPDESDEDGDQTQPPHHFEGLDPFYPPPEEHGDQYDSPSPWEQHEFLPPETPQYVGEEDEQDFHPPVF